MWGFRRLEKNLLLGESLKFGVIFQKPAWKLLKIGIIVEKFSEKCKIFTKIFVVFALFEENKSYYIHWLYWGFGGVGSSPKLEKISIILSNNSIEKCKKFSNIRWKFFANLFTNKKIDRISYCCWGFRPLRQELVTNMYLNYCFSPKFFLNAWQATRSTWRLSDLQYGGSGRSPPPTSPNPPCILGFRDLSRVSGFVLL